MPETNVPQTADVLMDFQKTASTAITSLEGSIRAFSVGKLTLHEAETSLRDARDVILREFAADPSPLGKNEAAREAALRARTANEQRRFDMAEANVIELQHAVQVSRANWDYIMVSLRIMELAITGKENVHAN